VNVVGIDLTQFIATDKPLYSSGVHPGGPIAHMGDHIAVVTDQKVGHFV
jgi:hypothetical protein